MSGFTVKTYNNLNLIQPANAEFERQLKNAGISLSDLLGQLAPLFVEEEQAGNRYSASLIHRHYSLNGKERMVARGNSTTPSSDTGPNIIPERWLPDGTDIEHRFIDNPSTIPPPPSDDFMKKFKEIVGLNNIDILGVSYAPAVDELLPGYILLEKMGTGDREQVISMVLASDADPATTYQSAWTLNSSGHCDYPPSMECSHQCESCPP